MGEDVLACGTHAQQREVEELAADAEASAHDSVAKLLAAVGLTPFDIAVEIGANRHVGNGRPSCGG